MLVDQEDVTAAIALQTSVQQLALVAETALAGILIATIGLSAVYGIDVATYAVAFVAAVLLPALMPTGGGAPHGVSVDGRRVPPSPKGETPVGHVPDRSQRHDLRHAPGRLSGSGGPPLRRRCRVVGLLYAAPGAGALMIGSLFTGWCSHVRHQGRAIAACVVVWSWTIALFGIIPVLWIGLGLLAVGRRRRHRFGGLPAGRPAAGRPRPSARAALGHLLRRGGRRPPPRRPRDRGGGGSRRPAVRRLVGGLACIAGVGLLLRRVPELWADDGGGQPLSAEEENHAIAEVITELGTGEPL